MDAATKADLRQEFIIALDAFPAWATQSAFDQWVRESRRRPSPGDIAALASLHVKTITDELSRRDRAAPEEPRERVSKERAAEILAAAGFRPKTFGGAE